LLKASNQEGDGGRRGIGVPVFHATLRKSWTDGTVARPTFGDSKRGQLCGGSDFIATSYVSQTAT